jgi:NAD-dependent deacetylase
MNVDVLFERLVQYLQISDKILIFTGAGISTGSGIPDFRGPNGVWRSKKPVYYQEFMSSEKGRLAYWEYKMEGWQAFRNAKPNATHKAIVDLERAGKLQFLVTQNIDGLHQKAGSSQDKLVELHGTMLRVECQNCHQVWDHEPFYSDFIATHKPPVCACGGYIKPATISFGQNLCVEDLERAETEAGNCDFVIAMGSTLSVYPAAGIPLMAAQLGRPYAIINQGITEHDHLPETLLRLDGDVSQIFPQAVQMALA